MKTFNKIIIILCMIVTMSSFVGCNSASQEMSYAQERGYNYYRVNTTSLQVFCFISIATIICLYSGLIPFGIIGIILMVCYIAFEYNTESGSCFLLFSDSSHNGSYKPIK